MIRRYEMEISKTTSSSGRLTEADIMLMIKDVERFNEENHSGQIQSATGFKLWSQKKDKNSKQMRPIAGPDETTCSHQSEAILTALPPPK